MQAAAGGSAPAHPALSSFWLARSALTRGFARPRQARDLETGAVAFRELECCVWSEVISSDVGLILGDTPPVDEAHPPGRAKT